MARINIEECWWSDPRRSRLTKLLGGDSHLADGYACAAWRLAQEFWKDGRREPIPKGRFEILEGASAILEAGLAELRTDGVYVRGSSEWLEWINESKENGSAGGKKSAEARRKKYGSAQPKRKKPEGPSKGGSRKSPNGSKRLEPSSSSSSSPSASSSGSASASNSKDLAPEPSAPALPTHEIWEAYRLAYQARYGVFPVRNPKVNGQLAQLASRLGREEAPRVTEFFLSHNDRFYLKAMHPVGLLLRDAEKLRTEWATNRKMTDLEAKSAESRDHYESQITRLCGSEQ